MLVWKRAVIRTLAERHPRIMDNALWTASDYLDWYLAAHIALSCHTARQRLAGVLTSLAPLLGRPVPGGVELDVTNEELGSAAHVTAFTASRLLNEWQRDRVVIKRRGRVVILAPDQLITVERVKSRSARAVRGCAGATTARARPVILSVGLLERFPYRRRAAFSP